MSKNREIRTFSLTKRAAEIVDSWKKAPKEHGRRSKRVSKLIEYHKHGCERGHIKIGMLCILRPIDEPGQWWVVTEEGWKRLPGKWVGE